VTKEAFSVVKSNLGKRISNGENVQVVTAAVIF